jgi:hypothetical protein
MKKTLLLALLLPCVLVVNAQDAAPSWLENSLYGNGKINAVIAVIAVILLGIGVWLYRQDRRLKRLEDAQRRS